MEELELVHMIAFTALLLAALRDIADERWTGQIKKDQEVKFPLVLQC